MFFHSLFLFSIYRFFFHDFFCSFFYNFFLRNLFLYNSFLHRHFLWNLFLYNSFLHRYFLRRNFLNFRFINSFCHWLSDRLFLYVNNLFCTFIIFILVIHFFQCWFRLFLRFRFLLNRSRTAVIFLLLKWCQWLILHLQFHCKVYIFAFTEPQDQIITFFQTFCCHSGFIIQFGKFICPLFNIFRFFKFFQCCNLICQRCPLCSQNLIF